jgi:hypothetical protein
LRWLCTRELREPLRSDVRDEVRRRVEDEEETHKAYREHQRQQSYHDQKQYSTGRRRGLPNLQDVDELISTGLKTLAKRFHPDLAGGDLARMQAINHAADWLRDRVRELLP